MPSPIVSPPKLRPGDRVAVLSPSWAGPGFAPAVHEQSLRRLREVFGVEPVEYPTTRMLGASPQARAADVDAAFADPSIRAILASIGGDDQVLVVPHLDPALPVADPKPFIGYSDNTSILNWLWGLGVRGFHGGSTLVHVGSGPHLDDEHIVSLRRALFDGGEAEVTEPGVSEDFGVDWLDPRALVEFGERTPTEPWTWAGPARSVEGPTWGGCLEVIDQLGLAGRIPPVDALEGAILLLETSEELTPAPLVGKWLRALGERGILGAVSGVLLARAPATNLDRTASPAERARIRAEQADAVLAETSRYNPDAVVCVGVPFGHTRPQWILPYGGPMRLDGAERRVFADYS